ncbi:MAG: type II toxin-antitoxin system HicB family antitoxin [Deltaproteobacteria bacterium]|nr:type II toxin-antitoxin system HicB family antitoxin [Deltaproteobacteria bacterium]MBW1719470.1 type II toxin-antitoxin system HicB family antitoxin [Deltaproteobacteria bacterium]MBW1939719.1 type II toxin-antitoxin system HicB family antitoxin [Deltaproteobacteria bacterium]MBW2350824.1 type II toxin-antitoxin system HicB family antitoxin [Deltaproteobacteria bacterium]
MNNLSYKGYTGTIEASIEDGCLHGQILFITDIITYEGNTVDEIKTSFEEAVDHYLTYCEETGKPANKPYSGTFNVRVGQDLHRKAVEVAFHLGITLNEFVAQSIKNAIEQNGVIRLEHTHHHNITITDNQTSTTAVATTDKPLAWEKFNAIQ